MSGVTFLINARPLTLTSQFLAFCKPKGWLVPPAFASESVRSKLLQLRHAQRHCVLVDNGRYDDLARLRESASAEALRVSQLMKAAHLNGAESPDRAALPTDCKMAVDEFAKRLTAQSKTVQGTALQAQLLFEPTAVVGSEDILACLWYACGLEPSFIQRGYGRLEAINKKNATLTASRQQHIGAASISDLPVAAAVDYESAFGAAEAFAEGGVTSFCIPFGAITADTRCTSRLVGPDGALTLDSSVPVRVLRAVLIARGIIDGWRASGQPLPRHVHLLGLGQPLILAMVASCLEEIDSLTFDATSPFKDAASGILYTGVPVFRRLDVGPVAAKLLSTKGARWDCPCPWCQSQSARQQWRDARSLFDGFDSAEKTAANLKLRRSDALGRLLPMLTVNPDREALIARVGHNHSVILGCAQALHRAKRHPGGLRRLALRWIQQYPTTERANAFHHALQMASKWI